MEQNQDASILSDPKSSKVKEARETCKEVSEFTGDSGTPKSNAKKKVSVLN